MRYTRYKCRCVGAANQRISQMAGKLATPQALVELLFSVLLTFFQYSLAKTTAPSLVNDLCLLSCSVSISFFHIQFFTLFFFPHLPLAPSEPAHRSHTDHNLQANSCSLGRLLVVIFHKQKNSDTVATLQEYWEGMMGSSWGEELPLVQLDRLVWDWGRGQGRKGHTHLDYTIVCLYAIRASQDAGQGLYP